MEVPHATEETKPLLNGSSSNYSDSGSELDQTPPAQCIGARHVLSFMAFLGFFNVYCLRVNLSVALVAMVNSSHSKTNKSVSTECVGTVNGTSSDKKGEFNWDEDTQGIILAAFFYGYIITQIPGGWLSEKFGGKKLFGFGVFGTAALTLLTPIAARWHLGALLAVRVLEGIGEGVTFPAMHAMFGKWAPVYERSKLAAFSYAGAQLGTVFSTPLSGLLCDSSLAGGWPSVFYVFGSIGCLWFVAWMLLIHDTPAEHPRISLEEKNYIERSIGKKKDLPTPWIAIFKTPGVWAINAAHFANNWGFYTMLTCLPTYMKNIQKFDIKTNGFLSALPYLGCWMGQVGSGFIADFLRKGYLRTVIVRKILNTVGLLSPAILLSCIQFAGCEHAAVVAMLTLALGLGGLVMGGFNVNHLDLSPNFAGVLLGISNSWATIPGFVGPQVVGLLTNHNESRAQWQIVFYITSAIYVSGAIIYLLFGTGSLQPWNDPEGDNISFAHKEGQQVQYRRKVPPQFDNSLSQSSEVVGVR